MKNIMVKFVNFALRDYIFEYVTGKSYIMIFCLLSVSRWCI